MIVRIVPIAPVVLKYFETIRTTGVIGSLQSLLKNKFTVVINESQNLETDIGFVHVIFLILGKIS